MSTYRSCGICGSNDTAFLHSIKFKIPDGIYLPDNYDAVMCNVCDLVFADTKATQDDYNDYYEKHNIYEGEASYSDKEKYKMIFDTLKKYIGKNESILEIGFANGELLKMLKKNGYNNLYGLDPSLKCVDNLFSGGIKAFHGSLLKYNLMGNTFDFIILSHVLEHVLDLKRAMSNVWGLLNNNGQVYIETPDLFQYAKNSDTPFSYFDLEHINHFSHLTIDNLAVMNGFKYVDFGFKKWKIGNDKYYPAVWYIAQKRLNKHCGTYNYTKKYLEESFNKKYPEIEKLINTQKEVVVYGVGSLTQRLYAMGGLDKCNIKMYVDDYKRGTKFDNKEIHPWNDIKTKDTILVLSVYYSIDIVNRLRKAGLKNKIITLY